jgi:hypothetical protein
LLLDVEPANDQFVHLQTADTGSADGHAADRKPADGESANRHGAKCEGACGDSDIGNGRRRLRRSARTAAKPLDRTKGAAPKAANLIQLGETIHHSGTAFQK